MFVVTLLNFISSAQFLRRGSSSLVHLPFQVVNPGSPLTTPQNLLSIPNLGRRQLGQWTCEKSGRSERITSWSDQCFYIEIWWTSMQSFSTSFLSMRLVPRSLDHVGAQQRTQEVSDRLQDRNRDMWGIGNTSCTYLIGQQGALNLEFAFSKLDSKSADKCMHSWSNRKKKKKKKLPLK